MRVCFLKKKHDIISPQFWRYAAACQWHLHVICSSALGLYRCSERYVRIPSSMPWVLTSIRSLRMQSASNWIPNLPMDRTCQIPRTNLQDWNPWSTLHQFNQDSEYLHLFWCQKGQLYARKTMRGIRGEAHWSTLSELFWQLDVILSRSREVYIFDGL